MSGIKRWCVSRGVTVAESSAGPFVLHEDHLASHAYDEEKERALFRQERGKGFDLSETVNAWGDVVFAHSYIESAWCGWKACAKSRAKAAGCE